MKTQNILIGVSLFGLVGFSIYSIVQIKKLKATIKSQVDSVEKHKDILDTATDTVNKLKNLVKQNTDDLSSLSIKK